MHAHHIIPWQFADNALVQKAAKKGFHMNDILNGVELKKYTKIEFPDGVHASHPAYDTYVQKRLQEFIDDNNGINNIDNTEAYDFFNNVLLPELRNHIDVVKNGYSGNLNDYFKYVINPSKGY